MQTLLAPIVLTCGDPSGIGPEIAVKARLNPHVPDFAWLGDARHLPQGAAYQLIENISQAAALPRDILPVLQHDFGAPALPGQPDLANAAGTIAVIERAVALVKSGAASAICTAPINKKVLKDGANFAYPGHTEFLAHLGDVENVVMMLACSELRVVPATIHIAVADVPKALTPELLEETIRITAAGLQRDFGLNTPRIAVAGLNPHAGEGGAMGSEEQNMMIPLLTKMQREGFDLIGPMPADTMFHAKARAGYDVAICAYHDQALIPIKTIDFAGGVNVTLGLPFVRTSPDHGTAYNIAGQGIADPSSLIAALKMAQEMAMARQSL